MTPAKKLQVFVSSTYTDLTAERQAAVEAILSSGHIPAGMELFAAGDQSQMSVIRRWIDESDVFLLILGGRYGSLEPASGKSYTHLEYEYATERGKPLFAVVIEEDALEERVKSAGTSVIEIQNAAQLGEFRKLVLSKVVRFWSDLRDIKLAIHETMGEFSRRTDLTGWIPGDQGVNTNLLAEELARLARENAELQKKIAESARAVATYNGLTFDELANLLRNDYLRLDAYVNDDRDWAKAVVAGHGIEASLLDLLWTLQEHILAGGKILRDDPRAALMVRLANYGVVRVGMNRFETEYRYELTPDGRNFTLRLLADIRADLEEEELNSIRQNSN